MTVYIADLYTAKDINLKLYNKCIYPTILISDVQGAHGSGVIVKSEYHNGKYINVALTCEHVVSNGNAYKAYVTEYKDLCYSVKRKSYDIFVYATFKKYDIAVILFNSDTQLPVADIDVSQKLYIGNDICGTGCSQLDYPRLDYGKINQLSDEYYKSSLMTIPGDSGGPVFYNYKLIGLKQAIKTIDIFKKQQFLFQVSHITSIRSLQITEGCEFVYNKESLPDAIILIMNFHDVQAPTLSPFDNIFPSLNLE